MTSSNFRIRVDPTEKEALLPLATTLAKIHEGEIVETDGPCQMLVVAWGSQLEAAEVETLILRTRTPLPPKRILVPVGGGAHALLGVKVAYELATEWGCDLEILRIEKVRGRGPDDTGLIRDCKRLEEELRLRLKVMEIDAPVTIVPAPEVVFPVVDRATADDLIVVGAPNEWRQKDHPTGSIPDEIANRVPGSVIMVRAPAAKDVRLSRVFWGNTIRLNLNPKDKWDAINQMIDALIEEKQVPASERKRILDRACEREKEGRTTIGHETAVCHAPMLDLPGIIGCFGICPDGVDFEDGQGPVKYIFLLLTPRRNYRGYLPLLGAIASFIRSEGRRAELLQCRTPAEASAVIRKQELG